MDNLEYEPNRIYQQAISTQPEQAQLNMQPGAGQLAFFNRLLSSVGKLLVGAGNRLIERAHAARLADDASPPNFIIML